MNIFTLKGTPLFLSKTFFLFVCSTDRVDVDENRCFPKIVKISLFDETLKKDIFAHFYTRQSIRSLIEYASNARLWTSLELKYTKKLKFN